MFETDLIILMQQGAPAWFAELMGVVTFLGNGWIYMPVLLVMMFGARVRPAFGVLLALVLAGFLVGSIKEGIALPRPADIDASVLNKGEPGHHVVEDGAAKSFWSLPSAAAIEAVRAEDDDSYGFVSGHAANALVLVFATLLFFGIRSRAIWLLAALWPLTMGLSRMFLGRHFLADVLGGLLVGIACVLLARVLLKAEVPSSGRPRFVLLALCLACALVAMLSAGVAWLDPAMLGSICGTLVCVIALERFGFPADTPSHWKRAIRVVLAVVIGYGVTWALDAAYAATGLPEKHFAVFFFTVIGYLAALLGPVLLFKQLKLYGAREAA